MVGVVFDDRTLRLRDEGLRLDPTTLERRRRLAEQLMALPRELAGRLQYLQPQVGCYNACAFCSQEAGRDVWQLPPSALRDILAALRATLDTDDQRLVGYARTAHRPGTVFPYLDNDIGSYPHLDEYVRLVADNLGCRTRLTTVGVSASNEALTSMHARIATELAEHIDGLRLSFTPYTDGWVAGARDGAQRSAFLDDFTETLKIYRPLLDHLGAGSKNGVCIELRFAPLLEIEPVHETTTSAGETILMCGPHVLRSTSSAPSEVSTLTSVIDGVPYFNREPTEFVHYSGDLFRTMSAEEAAAFVREPSNATQPSVSVRPVNGYRFANADGPYWAFDPAFLASGRFEALHIYPRTMNRRQSGYTNATRHWLNELVDYKRSLGSGRRTPMPGASWCQVTTLLDRLAATAERTAASDDRAARHIQDHILPMVTAIADCMRRAGYPAGLYFDPDFLIDTGQIVNQGKAKGIFRGLVSRNDEPMTPMEERGYGATSISSERGPVWRIAPAPSEIHGRRLSVGGKNSTIPSGGYVVQELDPRHLRPVRRDTGEPLRTYHVSSADIEQLTYSDGKRLNLFPGSSRHVR